MTEPTKPAPAERPRVLLVDPYRARDDPMERKFIELYPSLGLLTLAAFLRSHGCEVSIVDLTFSRDDRDFERALERWRPQVVGLHTKTLTYRRSISLARRAKSAGAVVVAGGPDAATRTDEYLADGVDAVAYSEGEEVLLDLARNVASGRPVEPWSGLAVRKDGKVVRGPPRPFLKDLDSLPLPAWDLVDMEAYLSAWERKTGERRAAILTSRGCPFHCSWCSKPTFGTTFRQQSPARVLAELRALRDRYRVNYVRFCDDVFGIQRSWLTQLLDGMERERLDLHFECLARVDLLKPDLLPRLKAAGLARVYVGVESGSQRMLDLMSRGTRLSQVESVATALRREGIRQFWFLMLGYPGETLEDIEATLELFRRFSPEEYSVSIAVPIPGTRFFDSVRDRLKDPGARRASDGGKTLLYEAAYPNRLYRWQQTRFRIEAALARTRGRLPDRAREGLSRTADRFNEKVATPLLTGGKKPR